MAESADKTPSEDSTLDEDSEVVELTDEVGATTPVSLEEDEFDSMGLEMPEFKVPGQESSSSAESTGGDEEEPQKTERLPREALENISADAKIKASERGTESNDGESDSEPAESSSADAEELQEPDYDRQAMVKTIQMDAFDREAVDNLGKQADGNIRAVLNDARFSPEIIPFPPQVLVKKWREGLPGEVELIVSGKEAVDAPPRSRPEIPTDDANEKEPGKAGQAEGEVDDPPELPPGPDAAAESEVPKGLHQEEGDSEPIELNDEVVEVDEAPAVPPESPPKKKSQKSTQKSARAEVKADAKSAADQGDSEMRGLVQELLEEEKEQKASKTARIRPKDVWFKNVFNEEYLRSVPKNIAEITKDDVDFIESSLRLKKKARILDLACGFGRHSIALANRGYEMVGLDLSRPLLERALEVAKAQSLSVKFLRGDMRELNFSGIFDGCFIWDTSLGYFDDRRNLGVLQGVGRALKVGGRLLIDVVNRDFVVHRTPTRLWWEGTGCIFLEESEFDYQTSTLQVQRSYIYEDGSPPLEQTSFIRLYNVHELRQMLHVAGFKVVEVSGAKHYKGQFLGAASERIIVLAEKRKAKRRRPGRAKKATKPVKKPDQ